MAEVLPLEIMHVNILPRLPLKSVFRFKCVCKEWRSFLSTSEFGTMHQYTTRDDESQTAVYKLLIVERPPWKAFRSLDYVAGKRGLATFHPTTFPDSVISVLASFDGLLCVAVEKTRRCLLWNPLTGFYKEVPNCNSIGVCFEGFVSIDLYKDSSNDYKLLLIFRSRGVFVYSRRLDSWRKIQDFGTTRVITERRWRSPATFFKTSLYFMADHRLYDIHGRSYGIRSYVISFDADSEKCREIQYPQPVSSSLKFYRSLVVIKGGLHLCVAENLGKEVELWRLEGGGDGWQKVVVVCSIGQQKLLRWTPICVFQNGEWLVIWEHEKVDTAEGFTEEQLCLYSASSWLKGVVYYPSLVSPNP